MNMKLQDKLNLWHRRFAHFNIKPIKNKLLNTNVTIKCPLCVQSKIKNKPYIHKENPIHYIFELIYMNLIGPLPESKYSNKNILTILDDFSRHSWILFLKYKVIHFLLFMNSSATSKIDIIQESSSYEMIMEQSSKQDFTDISDFDNICKKQKLREPSNIDDIQNLDDKNEWMKSVNEELQNMETLQVFEPIEKKEILLHQDGFSITRRIQMEILLKERQG
eukprot:jgi/Orpsp1_1/1182737/evm.model.c7180000082501.1